MRYAQIRSMDISNGSNIGVSLFVQGCLFHCKGCFNSETWDFNGGKEWTNEVKDKFLDLVSKPYIKRVSILGGEPLATQNSHEVFLLCSEIKRKYPDKKLWIYTGNTYENLSREQLKPVILADVLVDGQFIDELKDLSLKFRGSSNQRLIDVQKTLKKGEVVLWDK